MKYFRSIRAKLTGFISRILDYRLLDFYANARACKTTNRENISKIMFLRERTVV